MKGDNEEQIGIKERRIMIVPIGLEKHRVLSGCQIYPVNVVYLIINPKIHLKSKRNVGVFYYSDKFATSVLEKINLSFREINEIEAELNSFSSSIQSLKTIFEKEIKNSAKLSKIYINISTASKAFAIAAYIFACQHPELCVVFYMKTQNYILLDFLDEPLTGKMKQSFLENGLTKGPYEVDEIPLQRIHHYTEEERILILKLNEKQQFDSIKTLMRFLNYKSDAAHRIRLKRMLEKFETNGLVSLKRLGKKVKVFVSEQLNSLASFIG